MGAAGLPSMLSHFRISPFTVERCTRLAIATAIVWRGAEFAFGLSIRGVVGRTRGAEFDVAEAGEECAAEAGNGVPALR
jgi:hypothetical protein